MRLGDQFAKVFCFFSSEKKTFLCWPSNRRIRKRDAKGAKGAKIAKKKEGLQRWGFFVWMGAALWGDGFFLLCALRVLCVPLALFALGQAVSAA
jgi:hypothetical protein